MKSIREQVAAWARTKSPWIIHFNSGSCNGCDIETVAALTPRFDVERFGIVQHGSPRHADVLIVTGAVSKQQKDRLVRIYNQMANPKFVVALGACAAGGGVLQNCYGVLGGADKAIPVDLYVPGCPPRPEALIDGVVKLLSGIKGVENAK
ncbi:MAG: NADH-quinone oxidoreductase subunit NuoB [Elusimicrobiota bacterium]|jgi:NADH-quinone oxidoreductase B subunit|nr:NADH-quinone oxidoreductase subunit NuoB [Elusimicrobiota bacterium]